MQSYTVDPCRMEKHVSSLECTPANADVHMIYLSASVIREAQEWDMSRTYSQNGQPLLQKMCANGPKSSRFVSARQLVWQWKICRDREMGLNCYRRTMTTKLLYLLLNRSFIRECLGWNSTTQTQNAVDLVAQVKNKGCNRICKSDLGCMPASADESIKYCPGDKPNIHLSSNSIGDQPSP